MKKIFFSMILILLFVPIIMIYGLYVEESKEYKLEDEKKEYYETAIGDICVVERRNLEECYVVKAKVVSGKKEIIKLLNTENYVVVNKGDEIVKNQTIAYTSEGDEIKSPFNAKIIKIYDKYIVAENLDFAVIECSLNKDEYEKIIKEERLYTKSNKRVYIEKKSNLVKEGMKVLNLNIKGKRYEVGDVIEKFYLYNGKQHSGVLTIDNECVYKKDDGEYYVRVVNEKGEVIEEKNVGIGYSDGIYTCISGIDENTFCDNGYKKIMEIN